MKRHEYEGSPPATNPNTVKEAMATYYTPPTQLSGELSSLLEKWSTKLSPEALAKAIAATFTKAVASERASRLPSATIRGLAAREELKSEHGGHISADEARRFLNHISKTTVLSKHHTGKLLAWKEGRAFRFPVWQFAPEGGLLPGMKDVLAVLDRSPALDDWGKVLFFLNPRHSLNGETALETLRRGDIAVVLRLAEGELE